MDVYDFDYIVVGSGLSGAITARELAERLGYRVLVLEKNAHIGGSTFDEKDDAGILIHKYGPHIFHTNNDRVWNYLSRFTEWRRYEHRVLGNLFGKYVPIPFNFNAIEMVFGAEKGTEIINKLIASFGENSRVSIKTLLRSDDTMICELAEYVYENIFLHYTTKQWGILPSEVDKSVLKRVPIVLSRDDRYFADKYQGLPKYGYTEMFEKILDHPKIKIRMNTDAVVYLRPQLELGSLALPVVYTGALDELFGYRHGPLPYRTIQFEFETLNSDRYQPAATVNYTVSETFTRITEFKQLTGQVLPGKTSILREYPLKYEGTPEQTPYYPIKHNDTDRLYENYMKDSTLFDNLYLAGRLAEYRYYNMDEAAEQALKLSDFIAEKSDKI